MIYVVRHGETDGNLSGQLRGSAIDDHLNANGIAQAHSVAEQLKNIRFDAVYCSPLTRTKQTCDIILMSNPVPKAAITYDKRILPRVYGKFAGKPKSEMLALNVWNRAENLSLNDAESILDFEGRIFEFYDDIKKRHKHENVLVVTHGSVTIITRGYFDGLPENGGYTAIKQSKNCEILKYSGLMNN